MVKRLEEIFGASVDVQCGQGMDEALLSYVTGYTAKASDAMSWRASQYGDINDSQWLRTYRMLTKRAPTGPEMAVDLAMVPLMLHTYEQAATYAQVPFTRSGFGEIGRLDIDTPKSRPIPDTVHRKLYDLYLDREQQPRLPPDAVGFQGSFAEFVRIYRYDASKQRGVRRCQSVHGKKRQGGSGEVSCSVGWSFSWEGQDNFVGQFMSTFVPHDKTNDWELCEPLPRSGEPPRPENTRFLTAALRSACRPGGAVRLALQRWMHEEDARLAEYVEFARDCEERAVAYNKKASVDIFRHFDFQSVRERAVVREWLDLERDVSPDSADDREVAFLAIQAAMVRDLGLRGATPARRYNFRSTIRARFLLVSQWLRPGADAAFELIKKGWNLERPHHLPPRTWSEGQAELLRVAREALSVDDANELRLAPVLSRFVHVSGEPGCGKSEALIYAAHEASGREARVLIACPTGVLVGQYRDRLPSTEFITVETIHSAWRVLRDYDRKTYSPPSRLTQYDAVFIDEVLLLHWPLRLLLLLLPPTVATPSVQGPGGLQLIQHMSIDVLLRRWQHLQLDQLCTRALPRVPPRCPSSTITSSRY